MSSVEKSCHFVCYKWLLFGCSFILIYFDLMLILFSTSIANLYQSNQETVHQTVMVESIISILFSLVGMIGAIKENYCCTVLFSLFMTISVVSGIYSSLMAPVLWFLTFLYIFITIISFSFAKQIRERLIEQVLQPQSAFMRDYGRTYGLRFNSFQFFNENSNPVLQVQTIELEGRQLPPYYSCDNQATNLEAGALPRYEELTPYPPSYDESLRNANKTIENDNNSNNDNNYVQHI